MFSEQFEQVYSEVFTSATGRDMADPSVQDEHDQYVAEVEEALLDHWTDPDVDLYETTFKRVRSRGAALFQMRHPHSPEFTAEDARDIARIRFLGHAIIETAQRYAPPIDRPNYDNLSFRTWYDAHGKQEVPADRQRDPDCPSPLRLKDWPNGDYINCLGISIAVAGQQNRDSDAPFFYMNRLRHTDYEAGQRFMSSYNKLRTMHPDIDESLMPVLQIGGRLAYDDALRYEKYFKSTPTDRGDLPTDNNFHHAIISSQEGTILSKWSQVDPYGLVIDSLSPYPLMERLDEMLDTMNAGTCNEVIMLDSDVIDYSYKKLDTVLYNFDTLARRFRESVDGNYKSTNYLRDVKEQFLDLYESMWLTRDGQVTHVADVRRLRKNDPYERITERSAKAYWLTGMLGIYARTHGDDALLDDAAVDLFNEEGRFLVLDKPDTVAMYTRRLEEEITKALRTDAKTQKATKEIINIMQYLLCFNELYMRRTMTQGGCDQAMEIADPAFMIGAMYLNHYATWRKDGKVNVAKEIARLTPSQLIWQAAVARETDVTDKRVKSVGKLVKSLKNDQLHPLVRITLPTVKE